MDEQSDDLSDDLTVLRQRVLQFLVHSFLYYKLDEPVVSDSFFDQIAVELNDLRGKHPEADIPYPEIVNDLLGPEASGFKIKEFPPRIISTAFKLLYATSNPGIEFVEFVEKRGYQAQFHPED